VQETITVNIFKKRLYFTPFSILEVSSEYKLTKQHHVVHKKESDYDNLY
jgi:hypothetical protein